MADFREREAGWGRMPMATPAAVSVALWPRPAAVAAPTVQRPRVAPRWVAAVGASVSTITAKMVGTAAMEVVHKTVLARPGRRPRPTIAGTAPAVALSDSRMTTIA